MTDTPQLVIRKPLAVALGNGALFGLGISSMALFKGKALVTLTLFYGLLLVWAGVIRFLSPSKITPSTFEETWSWADVASANWKGLRLEVHGRVAGDFVIPAATALDRRLHDALTTWLPSDHPVVSALREGPPEQTGKPVPVLLSQILLSVHTAALLFFGALGAPSRPFIAASLFLVASIAGFLIYAVQRRLTWAGIASACYFSLWALSQVVGFIMEDANSARGGSLVSVLTTMACTTLAIYTALDFATRRYFRTRPAD